MTNEKQSAVAAHMELVDDLVRACARWQRAKGDDDRAQLEATCHVQRTAIEQSAKALSELKVN